MRIHLLNAACFCLQALVPAVTAYGAKVSRLVTSQPHRLLTPIVLHGGVGHLAMNTYSLQNVGPLVESVLGPGRFLAAYALSGAAGNVLSAITTPNPSVGASGAVFGLVGAYYVFLKRNEAFFGESGKRGMAGVQRTLVMNLAFGLSSSNVDNWGHVGGAIGGAAVSYYFGPRLRLMETAAAVDDDNSDESAAHSYRRQRVLVDQPMVRLPDLFSKDDDADARRLKRLRRRVRTEGHLDALAEELRRRKERRRRRPWRR